MNRVAALGAVIVLAFVTFIAVRSFSAHRATLNNDAAALDTLAQSAAIALKSTGTTPVVGTTWTTSDPRLGTVTYDVTAATSTSVTVKASTKGNVSTSATVGT